MRLIVMTPMARMLDCEDVIKVRVCLDDGSWLSLYAKHASIITAVSACEMQYEDMAGVCSQLEIGSGVMQLKDDTVSIYINETPEQDVASADTDSDLKVDSIDRLTEQLLAVLDQDSR